MTSDASGSQGDAHLVHQGIDTMIKGQHIVGHVHVSVVVDPLGNTSVAPDPGPRGLMQDS